MITVDEHNANVIGSSMYSGSERAGVLCPECNDELFYGNGTIVMTTNPPHRAVFCGNCQYIGKKFL